MRRKAFSLICLLYFSISIFLYSCKQKEYVSLTPKEFINFKVVNRADYVKDSLLIAEQLRVKLIKGEEFFSNSAYLSFTKINVDTIIYYGDLKKLAAIIIVENPTYRNFLPADKYGVYYYNGTCYLGKKTGDSLHLDWVGPSFSNSVKKEELSALMKSYFFTGFASNDTTAPHFCKYNLNDVRFKDCNYWDFD